MNRLSGLRLADGAGASSLESPLESEGFIAGSRRDVRAAGGGISEAARVVAGAETLCAGDRACETARTERSRAGVAVLELLGILADVALVMRVKSTEMPP